MIAFRCHSCAQSLHAPEQAIGQSVRCFKCDQVLLVPGPDPFCHIDEGGPAVQNARLLVARRRSRLKTCVQWTIAVFIALGGLAWLAWRYEALDTGFHVGDICYTVSDGEAAACVDWRALENAFDALEHDDVSRLMGMNLVGRVCWLEPRTRLQLIEGPRSPARDFAAFKVRILSGKHKGREAVVLTKFFEAKK